MWSGSGIPQVPEGLSGNGSSRLFTPSQSILHRFVPNNHIPALLLNVTTDTLLENDWRMMLNTHLTNHNKGTKVFA
jgi:hypothetical protein